ncbi:acylglycerol lipase [Saccharomycopsis crataegensis]|uniref:Acylglycerol lipase n=1 Tax=Saccharomycopsis crataegensis TaxID=43959 RepID=A0AAV5QHM6_9ASCO|nr:acylglycerol lipase [Saccharomycopsis crataegensis]
MSSDNSVPVKPLPVLKADPPHTTQSTIVKSWVTLPSKSNNGPEFFTVQYQPPSSTTYKGSILVVHGFAEYYELYSRILDDLCQQGYEVFYFDQRGSGHTSPGKYKGKSNEYYTFKDLEHMVELRLQEVDKRDNKKLYLLGHSMGGGIILNYLVYGNNRDKLAGAICCAPLVDLHPDTKPNVILRTLASTLNFFVPNFKIDSDLTLERITTDPEWQEFLLSNKDISKTVGTVSLFHGMFQRGSKLLDPDHLKNQEKKVPILIVHGEDDKINDYKASEKFVNMTPAEDVTLKGFSGTGHSLFLERPEVYEQVTKTVFEWLESH